MLNPVSLIPNQTNITSNTYFFLEANISTLNVNNLSTGNITANSISCLTGQISSFLTNFISSANGEINELTTSTISTTQLDLDGQTLNATATELLLNGIPIATTQNLSSIGDWALEPAISSIDVAGFDVLNANNVSCINVKANNGQFNNLFAFNIFAFSTYTSTISSLAEVADFGFIDNLSSGQAFIGSLSTNTLASGQGVISSLLVSSINNAPIPVSAENWSQFPATQQVNMRGNNIYSGNSSSLTVQANVNLNETGRAVYINADDGGIISNSLIQLSTTNGYRGEIDMIANEGNVLGGKITMTAKGADVLGLLYGGVIELTAETGGGFIPSPALTSAIRLSAASILEYSGATNSIGSVAGYGFYHGDAGLNLTAGVPPLAPNDPLTVYMYGTNGVLIFSDTYVKGPIRPYSDLTNNPQDLYIEAYNNLITTGYIQLRGVSTQTFYGGDSAILGLNRLQFSSIAGALENVSSINGQPITFYEPGGVSTVSTFTELFASSIQVSTITALDAAVSSVVGLSSINGVPISEYQNVSSISSLNEWALYPALSSIKFATGVDAVVESANTTTDPILIIGSNIELLGSHVDAYNLLLVSTLSTAVIQGANDSIFAPLLLGTPGLKLDAPNIFLSTTQTNITGLINSSTITANLHTGRAVEVSTIAASTISLGQQGPYGLSSLMYLSTSQIPGFGTSTTTYINTDVSLLQNDFFCQQIRLGYLNPSSQPSEIIFHSPNNTQRAFNLGNGDQTIRIQSTANATVGGYILDTQVNAPFFSTINGSTNMMAFFPSTTSGTIGISTISVIPPTKAYGSWYSSTSQTVVGANTVTALSYNTQVINVGGFTYAGSTITVPFAGDYEITHSIQFDTTSGGTNAVQFWLKKNGVDIPQTNSIVSITNNGDTLGTISVIDTATANDNYAVVIYSADTNMTVSAAAAGTTPAVPSIITNIKKL